MRDATIDEAVAAVNDTLRDIGAGPERFKAIAPGTVEVIWQEFSRRETRVPAERKDKLGWVHGQVAHRLKMHRLPQVLITDETGAVTTLFGAQYGTFDPAAVFGASATAG